MCVRIMRKLLLLPSPVLAVLIYTCEHSVVPLDACERPLLVSILSLLFVSLTTTSIADLEFRCCFTAVPEPPCQASIS